MKNIKRLKANMMIELTDKGIQLLNLPKEVNMYTFIEAFYQHMINYIYDDINGDADNLGKVVEEIDRVYDSPDVNYIDALYNKDHALEEIKQLITDPEDAERVARMYIQMKFSSSLRRYKKDLSDPFYDPIVIPEESFDDLLNKFPKKNMH